MKKNLKFRGKISREIQKISRISIRPLKFESSHCRLGHSRMPVGDEMVLTSKLLSTDQDLRDFVDAFSASFNEIEQKLFQFLFF